ncbi:MAG: SsrA-binding protein SmpB [Dehalococcoidia bacterium]|jgi:SsrA-binding protein|nr:SsrA-binding protein SmpB [Dehalococcoidia bacterium]
MGSETRTITVNRKAYHDYTIGDTYEAGIVLQGSEIKSIRAGHVNLKDAYARVEKDELWLMNCHIAQYDAASYHGHEPDRPRKLLLHRKEVLELAALTQQKSLTLIPVRLYIKGGIAKVALAVGRGKKLYDKRESIAKRDEERELDRVMKERRR